MSFKDILIFFLGRVAEEFNSRIAILLYLTRHITCGHDLARTVSAMLHNSYISRRSSVEIVENTVMLKHALAVGSYSDAIAYYLEGRCGFYDLRHGISSFPRRIVLYGAPGLTLTLWPLFAKPFDVIGF
jgi:hypothetical protein